MYEPINLDDNMTADQVRILAALLQEIIEYGYGEVIITVSNHHVNKWRAVKEGKLGLPAQNSPPSPTFRSF